MGYFLDGFIYRINNAKPYMLQEATDIINAYLLEDSRFIFLSSLAQKEHLLRAVKTIMAERLGIEPGDVKFGVKKQAKTIAATTLRDKCDGLYTIVINENLVEKITTQTFLNSILHEYGHIDLIIKEKQGQKVPFALFTESSEKRKKLNIWQRMGYLFEYSSNENELYANLFSINTMKEFIKNCKQFGEKSQTIRKVTRRCNLEGLEYKLVYAEASLLKAGWSGINKVLRIKSEDYASLEPCSSGYVEIAISINQMLDEYGLRGSAREGAVYIKHINDELANAVLSGEPIPEYNESVKMVYASYCCMLLSRRLDLDNDKIGQCYDAYQQENIRFIRSSEHRKDCPLYGYFCFNREFFEASSMPEFIAVLTREMNNVAKEEQLKEISLQ